MMSKDHFDPSCFGDAVAMQTLWVPMSSGGINFDTHEMVIVSSYRIEFKALPILYFSYITGIIIFTLIATILNDKKESLFLLFAVFILAVSFPRHSARSVFDKRKMLFWKGRSEYDFYIDTHFKKIARLYDIHAIQLLYKVVENEDGTDDDNYELNIILNDSRRINIVSYTKKDDIRRDAAFLAEFLRKPLWDAIDLQSA